MERPDNVSCGRQVRAVFADVRWLWVGLAGAGSSLLSAMLALLASEVCTAFVGSALKLSKVDMSRVLYLCDTVVAWGAFAVNALITFILASWVARQAKQQAAAHGTLVGSVSALTLLGLGLIAGLRFGLAGGAQETWNVAMLVLTVGGGWLGGRHARRTLLLQDALYATGQAISTAHSHQAIVDAIGKHLTDARAGHITLWQVQERQSDGPTVFGLLAAWSPPGVQGPAPEAMIDSNKVVSLTSLYRGESVSIDTGRVSRPEQAAWERLGIRSAFLYPLLDAQETLIGMLLTASPAVQPSKQGVRHVRLFGPQVALALQNLRLLEGTRDAAVLAERQRLAREIHDTLAQDLASIVVHLEAAEQALSASGASGLRHVVQARDMAREGLSQARGLVWALRPDILGEAPLYEALKRVAERWGQDHSIPVRIVTTGDVYPLSPNTQITLLRVLQEALANVHKHASATEVTVTLSYMGDLIVLDVQDDGRGFDLRQPQVPSVDPERGGFGLCAMRERVEQLGGTLLLESVPGQGTTVVVEVPTCQ